MYMHSNTRWTVWRLRHSDTVCASHFKSTVYFFNTGRGCDSPLEILGSLKHLRSMVTPSGGGREVVSHRLVQNHSKTDTYFRITQTSHLRNLQRTLEMPHLPGRSGHATKFPKTGIFATLGFGFYNGYF